MPPCQLLVFTNVVLHQAGMAESMMVLVHVKQRTIPVSCGDGTQPVRWLANVGITRHDESLGRALGAPVGVKLATGQLIPLNQRLIDAGLRDGHVKPRGIQTSRPRLLPQLLLVFRLTHQLLSLAARVGRPQGAGSGSGCHRRLEWPSDLIIHQ